MLAPSKISILKDILVKMQATLILLILQATENFWMVVLLFGPATGERVSFKRTY